MDSAGSSSDIMSSGEPEAAKKQKRDEKSNPNNEPNNGVSAKRDNSVATGMELQESESSPPPDKEAAKLMIGRMEYALGFILKDVMATVAGTPAHRQIRIPKLKRMVKRIIRDRIQSTVAGRIIGVSSIIIQYYRAKYPEETDRAIVDTVLELARTKNLITSKVKRRKLKKNVDTAKRTQQETKQHSGPKESDKGEPSSKPVKANPLRRRRESICPHTMTRSSTPDNPPQPVDIALEGPSTAQRATENAPTLPDIVPGNAQGSAKIDVPEKALQGPSSAPNNAVPTSGNAQEAPDGGRDGPAFVLDAPEHASEEPGISSVCMI